ncbi:MAG TPA: hypothetical protein VLS89_17385, partial [Candidatus Nanopelagicales bacterium]|nr:hypothetical protein [Candidatus Nanopelagicales bacterium]
MTGSLRFTAAFAAAITGAACGGPLTPSPVEGEPVCPDFELGATRTKMRGSLRYPVQVTVLEGDKVLSKATLYGLREPGAAPSRALVPDDTGEYEVRWAQCTNERAPRPEGRGPEGKDPTTYECGEGPVYKTEQITTKAGDPASRKLTFVPPPRAECWVSDT